MKTPILTLVMGILLLCWLAAFIILRTSKLDKIKREELPHSESAAVPPSTSCHYPIGSLLHSASPSDSYLKALGPAQFSITELDLKSKYYSYVFKGLMRMYEEGAFTGPTAVYLYKQSNRAVDLFDVILSVILENIYFKKVKSILTGELSKECSFYLGEENEEFSCFVDVYHKHAPSEELRSIIVTLEDLETIRQVIGQMGDKNGVLRAIQQNKKVLQKHLFSTNFFLLMKDVFKCKPGGLTESEVILDLQDLENTQNISKLYDYASLSYDIMNDEIPLDNEDIKKTYLLFASSFFHCRIHGLKFVDLDSLKIIRFFCSDCVSHSDQNSGNSYEDVKSSLFSQGRRDHSSASILSLFITHIKLANPKTASKLAGRLNSLNISSCGTSDCEAEFWSDYKETFMCEHTSYRPIVVSILNHDSSVGYLRYD